MTRSNRAVLAALAVATLGLTPVAAQTAPDTAQPNVQGAPETPAKPGVDAQACGKRFEDMVRSLRSRVDDFSPQSDAQRRAIDALKAAAAKALDTLHTACADEKSAAAVKDLEAAQKQLETAMDAVVPALEKFYGSLSDEQKEKLKSIGEQLQGMAKDWSALVVDLDRYLRNPDGKSGQEPFRMCLADVCFTLPGRSTPEPRQPRPLRDGEEEI